MRRIVVGKITKSDKFRVLGYKKHKGLLIMNLYDEDLNNLDGSRIPILENGILSIPRKIDNRPINTGASWIIRDENGHKQKYLLSKYCNGKHTFTRYKKV